MMHFVYPRVRRYLAFLTALLFISGVSTCGNQIVSDEITVVVDVAGLTPDITELSVSSSLNGGAVQSSPDITGRLDQFVIGLPLDKAGHLVVNVVAHSAEQCVVATGQLDIDISAPPTRYNVSLTLNGVSGGTKTCALTVQVQGKGTITSQPAGIQCTNAGTTPMTCSGDFPVGTTISLTTSQDPKVYGVVYGGLCTGTAPCSINFSGPGTVSVGFAARVCSSDNWCWYSPLPQGNSLHAIWGSAANDVWAVGDFGTFLHFDGLTWSSPSPIGSVTQNDLYGIYGSSASDIWAVGLNGTLVHYDGTTWTVSADSGVRTTQGLRAVWGSGPNNYLAVGYTGTILKYDGSSWSISLGSGSLTSSYLYAVWGSAATDVWAVGDTGTILHYGGTTWTKDGKSGTLTSATLYSIAGTAQNKVLATSTGNVLVKYDGSNWALDPASGNYGMGGGYGLWLGKGGTAWVVGYDVPFAGAGVSHFDGTTWKGSSVASNGSGFQAVWASSDTDVWALGYYGSIYHGDGQTFTPAPLSSGAPNYNTVESLWGTGANDVWSVGTGGLLRHFDGISWKDSPQSGTIPSSASPSSYYHVFGIDGQSVFAVGSGGTIL